MDAAPVIPPPCDKKIFDEGTCVFVSHSLGMVKTEEWVKKIALLSGQPVDWHYTGGRAVVLALGDLEKVKEALKALMPEHDALLNEIMAKPLLDGAWPTVP